MITTFVLYWLSVVVSTDAAPNVETVMRKVDAMIGPPHYEATAEVTNHRGAAKRVFKLRILKGGTDKVRISFTDPAALRGQEMLRDGDGLWLRPRNAKKPTKMAARDPFQGGELANGDVCVVGFGTDYNARLSVTTAVPRTWELELTPKRPDAAHKRIKLWVRIGDMSPMKAEFYGPSDKRIRDVEFQDPRDFGNNLARPSKIVVRNSAAPKRWSEMVFHTLDTKTTPPASKFALDDLGR